MALVGQPGVLGIRTARLDASVCLEQLWGGGEAAVCSQKDLGTCWERVKPVHIARVALTILRGRGYNGK